VYASSSPRIALGFRLGRRGPEAVALLFFLGLLGSVPCSAQQKSNSSSSTSWIVYECIGMSDFKNLSFPEQDICEIDQNGKHKKRLTTDHRSHDPVWSPDGQQIAYITDERRPTIPDTADQTYNFIVGYWNYLNVSRSLVKMNAPGGNPQVLGSVDSSTRDIAWLPNGLSIALRISDWREGEVIGTGSGEINRLMAKYDGRGTGGEGPRVVSRRIASRFRWRKGRRPGNFYSEHRRDQPGSSWEQPEIGLC
jgi:hypothetical protein